MILTFRKFLLFFLVLLQFFAPLIHAHADEHFVELGLHLPTPEFHSETHENLSHHAINYCQSPEHTIISISQGNKNKKQSLRLLSNSFFITPVFAFSPALKSCQINFSPQAFTQKLTSVSITPHSPRAPPISLL